MHCVVKVENWRGESIKGATNLLSEFENGEQLKRLIAIEDEFRSIAQEFEEFLNKCKECHNREYCEVTLEVALDEDVLVPATTVKVPSTEEGELRKLLWHIKDVCIDQMKEFLEEERVDNKPISIVSYELPAFFNGNIFSTLFH